MPEPRLLLVLGTRTFAEEVADLATDIAGVTVTAFVENMDRARTHARVADRPVLWVADLASVAASHVAVCALSTTHRSHFVDEVASTGLAFTTLVHPTAHVSRSATIGEGSIISAGVVVGAHARIGRHVIVNRGALIGHHTHLGDYVTLGPGANIGGCCDVQRATYVGIGAVVLDKLSIGLQSVVGAGAVVTRDVAARVQVLGVPARVTKEDIDGR